MLEQRFMGADDRRGDADRRIAGRDHHQGRADHHEPDRQGQPRLAAGAVGIGADHAQRSRAITSRLF